MSAHLFHLESRQLGATTRHFVFFYNRQKNPYVTSSFRDINNQNRTCRKHGVHYFCNGLQSINTHEQDAAARNGPTSYRGTGFGKKLCWRLFVGRHTRTETAWGWGGKPVQLHPAAHPPAQGPPAVWGNTATEPTEHRSSGRSSWITAAKNKHWLTHRYVNAVYNYRMETFTDTCTCKTSTSQRQTTSQHSGMKLRLKPHFQPL